MRDFKTMFSEVAIGDQGRSQDLDQSLQDIAQNFDDDVIIMTLTALS